MWKKNVVTSIQCYIRYSNLIQEKHIKEMREDREILFHLKRNREKIKDLTYNLSKWYSLTSHLILQRIILNKQIFSRKTFQILQIFNNKRKKYPRKWGV